MKDIKLSVLDKVQVILAKMYEENLERMETKKKAIENKFTEEELDKGMDLVLLGQGYGIQNMCEFMIRVVDEIKNGKNTSDAAKNALDGVKASEAQYEKEQMDEATATVEITLPNGEKIERKVKVKDLFEEDE